MKQKTHILIYILIAAAVVIVGTIIILMSRNNAGQEKSHLDLGRTYLLDLSYDKAILEFKEAINIDPNDPEPYIELANTYEEIGDIPNAIETLEDGYEKTGDERIKEKLDELQAKENESEHNEDDVIAASETSAVTTVSESETEASTSVTVEMATVPDLLGLNEEEAKKLCEDNGLKFTVSYSESNDVEKDIVMSQMIPAGTSVAKGIIVPFAVSEGNSVQVELVAENLQFDYLADFEESGWAFAVRGNKGGYVNTSGKFVEVYDITIPTEDEKFKYYDNGTSYDLLYMVNGRPYFEDTDECCPSYEFYINEFKVSAEGLYPYFKNEKWGYADINKGNIVIPCEYNSVSYFNCGRGVVSFDDPEYKANELYTSTYIPQKYKILDYNNNEITISNIKSLYPDATGAEIISVNCCFLNNILLCRHIAANGLGFIGAVTVDINGNILDTNIAVVPYDTANSDYIHDWTYYVTNGQTIIRDFQGSLICSLDSSYFVMYISSYGLAVCASDYNSMYGTFSKYAILDCNNNGQVIGQYDESEYGISNSSFNNEYIPRGKGHDYSWTLFDLNGNKVFKNEYEFVGNPSFDIISVKKNGKFGFVDINENLVIDYIFNDVYYFWNNDNNLTVLCENDNGPCLINKKGNVIYQYTGTLEYYDDIGDYTYIIIKNNGKYSIYKISMR